MNAKKLAMAGMLIFCLGASLGLFLSNLRQSAIKKDFNPIPVTGGGDDVCQNPLPVNLTTSKRTMAVDESQALTASITNPFIGKDCEIPVTLNAPNFDISPNTNKQNVTVPGNGKAQVVWILTPNKTGVFEVSVSVGSLSHVVGISVTNLFGLSSAQAQILSYVGSFFGPMLTAPWWYERVKDRKRKSKRVSKAHIKKA